MDRLEDRWNALYEAQSLVKEGRYVVIDLETASLEGEAIAWAVVSPNGSILGQGYIKPQGKITEGARAIHHISDEQVANAPTFDQVAPLIWQLLEGQAVVAYNAPFESERLYTSLCAVSGGWREQSEGTRERLSWILYRCDWRCAMRLFAAIYGELHPYFRTYTWQSLETACWYFHLEVRREALHDAVTDARATCLLVQKMAELASQELPAGYHPPRDEPCAGGCGQRLGPFSYDEDPTWYCLECGLTAGINCLCPRCEQHGKRTIVSSSALHEPVEPGTLCYSCQYEINVASAAWHLCPRCGGLVQAPIEVERFCATCQAVRAQEQAARHERKEALESRRVEQYKHVTDLVREGGVQLLEEQPAGACGLLLARSPEILRASYLTRCDVEPVLVSGFGGQTTLVVRSQGAYGRFLIPYIEQRVVYADQQWVVVLIAYHAASRYSRGRGGHSVTSKGQFYRFYRRSEQGWEQTSWRRLTSEARLHLAAAAREKAPVWARLPGERKNLAQGEGRARRLTHSPPRGEPVKHPSHPMRP